MTSANGAIVSETKYKAWGEVRQATGTSPTNYTYTGQYSYTADFGLMYYNARWYDPALGRFAQADTIVPSGVQGLDRYAYTGNNPINYTDPSGHARCDEEGNCMEGNRRSASVRYTTPQRSPRRASESRDNVANPNPPLSVVNGLPSSSCNVNACTQPQSSANPPLLIYGPPVPSYGNGLVGPPVPPGANAGSSHNNDFVYPWEINRLDAVGIRIEYGGFIPAVPILGGNGSLDFVYNLNSSEFSVLPAGTGMFGFGGGGSGSASVVLAYDAPNNNSLTGLTGGGAVNLTGIIGIQGTYGSSQSANKGQYAQVYTIGPSFGAEASLAAFLSYTPWNWGLPIP